MKQSRLSQVLLIVLFAALLATPLLLKKRNSSGATAKTDVKTALSRHGFYLEEVSRKAGIDFVHQPPTLDPKLDHIMPQIASMGAGVAVADFDRDGWQDLYVTNSKEGGANRLYRNKKDGTFEDVALPLGVADVNQRDAGVSMGAVWGDYDNDGFEDLFVYKWGRPELFHNDAGKKFSRVTDKAGDFPQWVNANTALWFDYNRDGRLDIYLGGYFPENVNLWKLRTTRMMPESFEYARNGGRNYLLRNEGNGTFKDVTGETGTHSRRWALAVAAADLRGTGYPDLVIANDYGVTEFFANQGGKRFQEIGKPSGIGYAPKSGMNASFGDVLNQGRFAIYVSNISEEGVLLQGNNLWVPKPGSKGNNVQYANMARDMGVELGGWSFGTQFGDLNNDGRLDLYLANGYVSADKNGNYWYDFSKIAGGNSTIIADAKNWPPMKGRSLSGYQAKKVWLNDGAGHFQEVAQSVGVTDRYDGRAVAMADFGNRGVLDVVVANQRGPLLFYRNTVKPENKWIEFDLQGTRSNRSAIGAQVRVFWNGMQQLQEVSGASGFCSQNQRRLHFGLGANPKIEKIEIRWPSGTVQTLKSPRPGEINIVKEPAA